MRSYAAVLIAGLSTVASWQVRADAPAATTPGPSPAAATPSPTPTASPAPSAGPATDTAPAPGTATPPAAPAPADAEKAHRRSVAFVAISRGDGIDEGLGSTIEEVLVAALSDTGRFAVVDHNQIADVLKLDAQKQALGCEDKSCVADVAGAMDVQLVGSAHVGHVGTISVITLKLLDAQSATAVVRTEENVQNDNALITAAQSLAGKAVLTIWPDSAAAPAATPAAGAPHAEAKETPEQHSPSTPAAAPGQPVAVQPAAGSQPAQAQPVATEPVASTQPAAASTGAPAAYTTPSGTGYAAPGAAQPAVAATDNPAPTGGLSAAVADLTSFEAPLAPYGTWMELPGVGHVWRPNPMVVGAGFRPYATGGHWAYTYAGWAFVSDFDWGWAPFHYGHWWYDQAAGWVWLPGHIWSPAWVRWREGGGYMGWAPLAPNGWDFRGPEQAAFWCFVEPRYMVEPRLVSYVAAPAQARTIYVTAAPIKYERGAFATRGWHPGPSVDRISVARGRPVTPVHYASVARPAPRSFGGFYGGARGGGYGQRGGYRGGYSGGTAPGARSGGYRGQRPPPPRKATQQPYPKER